MSNTAKSPLKKKRLGEMPTYARRYPYKFTKNKMLAHDIANNRKGKKTMLPPKQHAASAEHGLLHVMGAIDCDVAEPLIIETFLNYEYEYETWRYRLDET